MKKKQGASIKGSKLYNPQELLRFGIDHLLAAEHLSQQPHHYDSAGYLSHLGIELVLKAWLLDKNGKHAKIHDLLTLRNDCGKDLSLSDDSEKWLSDLDTHYALRYPVQTSDPIETGSDDWEKTDRLMQEIFDCLPTSLQKLIHNLDPNYKGGRVLMRKRKDAVEPFRDPSDK